jgi:hypothetical protein
MYPATGEEEKQDDKIARIIKEAGKRGELDK